jgi:hypothetical protein
VARGADDAPLFSNVGYSVERYLQEAEKGRHFRIPAGFPSPAAGIKTLLRTLGRSDGYVLLARDWHQETERGLREAFTVTEEWAFPGVKVLRVRKGHRRP